MKLARMLGATVVLLGFLTLFASPLAFACGPGGDSSGGSSSGSSSSGSSSSEHSSSGDSSGSSGEDPPDDDPPKQKHDDPEPQVIVVPRDKPRDQPRYQPPVRSAPRAPAAPVDPGADFLQGTSAPAGPAPVLDQNAVSRGAGAPAPTADVGGDPGNEPNDGSGLSPWAAISALTAAAGAGVVAAARRQANRAKFANQLHDPDASVGAQEITGIATVLANPGRFAPKPAVDPSPHPRDYSTPESVHYYLDPRGHWVTPPAQPGPGGTGTVPPGPPNPGPGQ